MGAGSPFAGLGATTIGASTVFIGGGNGVGAVQYAANSVMEKATRASRYDPRHYPHINLGRAYVAKEMLSRALAEFEQALAFAPDHPVAREAVSAIRRRLN